MDNREAGIQEIISRIKTAKEAGKVDVKTFKRNPTSGVEAKDLACVYMLEGSDEIAKYSNRSSNGYPARRDLEITLETIADASVNVRDLHKKLKAYIFKDGVQVATDVFIKEKASEGPNGYNIPGILGMRLILILNYMDQGIEEDL